MVFQQLSAWMHPIEKIHLKQQLEFYCVFFFCGCFYFVVRISFIATNCMTSVWNALLLLFIHAIVNELGKQEDHLESIKASISLCSLGSNGSNESQNNLWLTSQKGQKKELKSLKLEKELKILKYAYIASAQKHKLGDLKNRNSKLYSSLIETN